jgi:hypothetical protein
MSSIFSRASNNSRMRVSTWSGSFRVMTTTGFLRPANITSEYGSKDANRGRAVET